MLFHQGRLLYIVPLSGSSFAFSLTSRHSVDNFSEATRNCGRNSFLKRTLCPRFLSICLPRDGSFPKLKKLNFCNFSAHLSAPAKPHSFSLSGFTSTATSPLILPHELPNVHPFRAQQTFPLISPCILPANCPCRGMARGRNPGKIRVILAKYSDFMDRLSPFLEPFKGDSREIFGGDDRVSVRLSFEESPSLGRIFGG